MKRRYLFALPTLLVLAALPGFALGGREKGADVLTEPEITISWCNFTDTQPRRALQGPTGGNTSVGMFSGGMESGTGLPELPTTDIQTRLETKLGVRFRALGGPQSALVGKLIEFFGTPGAPRLPDAGPPAAADLVPDVFPYGYWCTGYPHDEKFIQDVCAGVTEAEVRTYMPAMARALRNVAESWGSEQSVWDHLKVAGKITWLPLNIEELSGATSKTPTGVLWRADVLEDLGLAVPSTIEQWDKIFESYHRRYPNKVVWRDDRNMFGWRSVYTATGVPYGNWIMRDGMASPWWVQPETKRALTTLQAWYQKGYLDTVEPRSLGPEAFITGDSILADLVEWEAGNWVGAEPYIPGSLPYRTHELNAKARFALSAPPRFEGVAELRLPLAQRNVLWGQFAFAKRLEKDRDRLHRIMAVIDRIASDRDTFLLAYHGVEGRDWKWSRVGTQNYPAPLLNDTQRQGMGLGRYWTQALYGLFLDYRMDPRVLESRAAMTEGTPALYGERVNRWNQDPRGLVQTQDPAVHQRLFEKESALYGEFERVQERIVRRGEPLKLFDEYLLYWREHGGPDLVAEVTELIDKTRLQ